MFPSLPSELIPGIHAELSTRSLSFVVLRHKGFESAHALLPEQEAAGEQRKCPVAVSLSALITLRFGRTSTTLELHTASSLAGPLPGSTSKRGGDADRVDGACSWQELDDQGALASGTPWVLREAEKHKRRHPWLSTFSGPSSEGVPGLAMYLTDPEAVFDE